MAHLYLDADVPLRVGDLLSLEGHSVTTAQLLGVTSAPDYEHLRAAARQSAILITRNHKDFVLLHGAWLVWSQEWGVTARHAGIVVVPHRYAGEDWTAPVAAARIQTLLREKRPNGNELYRWLASGWSRSP